MEIPGYQIQREIGHRGTSRIYLALQQRFGRPVALKVVHLGIEQTQDFKDRFMQEVRIVENLNHPHVVHIHDFGVQEEFVYLAMEYFPSGDLNRRLKNGLRIEDVIRVTKEIGGALDHAHTRGYIHRDVKPENILFREQNFAVLSDFGIASMDDIESSLTNRGTVMGTPRYMSPEQARGSKLDGRSDLYSLGIVFFQMLSGDVPYRADNLVRICEQHSQDPIPNLPSHLAMFQGLVDKLLAKQPNDRFQSGSDISKALDQIPLDKVVPNAVLKTEAVATAEIQALGTPTPMTAREAMVVRNDQGAMKGYSRRQLYFGVTLFLAITFLGTVGYYLTTKSQGLSEMLARAGFVEDRFLEEAWQIAEGLRQDPNQSLAAVVAAYRRVLDRDAIHDGAIQAIQGVASTWKEDIDRAIEIDDLALADAKLTESLNVFPKDAELSVLFERLSDRRRADVLLQSTQALLASRSMSHEPSATAAMQAYQEVLQLHPGNDEAEAQLDMIANFYTALAEAAVVEGNLSEAMENLGRAVTANPNFGSIEKARTKINQFALLQAEIDGMLSEASAYRAASALVDPIEANAAEIYHRVLATDPGNVIASQGLAEVAAQVLTQFNQFLTNGELTRSQKIIDRSVAVGLGDVPVDEMRFRYETEVERLKTVSKLLTLASTLFDDGYFTDPVGRNVVAKLREVIRLDPDNEKAVLLLSRTADRLANVAREAFGYGLTTEARHYLDLALTVTPDADEWRRLRDMWANEVLRSNR